MVGNPPLPWETILMVDCSHDEKRVPFVSSWNLLESNLYPSPLVFSTWPVARREFPSALEPAFKSWPMVVGSPLSLLSSRLNKPGSLRRSSSVRGWGDVVLRVVVQWWTWQCQADLWRFLSPVLSVRSLSFSFIMKNSIICKARYLDTERKQIVPFHANLLC